jgi:hypothetical protein
MHAAIQTDDVKADPGSGRIHCELLMLGFEVAQSTVSKIHTAG